ncbi:MAG: hypothetical protein HOD39_05785 [Verrucomicrobia bacterium]|nr:hypothetical protein [Verrucomicrobiota bacterium]
MKYIARRVNVDHGLALNLYDPLNYDAMYLAGLILDDVKMTKQDLHKWPKNAHGTSMEPLLQTMAWTASWRRYGWEPGLMWIESKTAHVAVSGWIALACLMTLRQDDEVDLDKVRELIQDIKRTFMKLQL